MKMRPTNRKAWLLTPVVCAPLLALAVWRAQSSAYKRFVSPPLGDGTRYTFLYPTRFTSASASSPRLYDDPPPTDLGLIRKWMGDAPFRYLPPRQGQIVATVAPQLAHAKYSRREKRRPGWHLISINGARSRSRFQVVHWGSHLVRFGFEDAVISDSFQILPPNSPAPSP